MHHHDTMRSERAPGKPIVDTFPFKCVSSFYNYNRQSTIDNKKKAGSKLVRVSFFHEKMDQNRTIFFQNSAINKLSYFAHFSSDLIHFFFIF